MKKNKNFKFGQSLKKGEHILVKETFCKNRSVFTAHRPGDETLEFGVTSSEFEFTEKEKFIVTVMRTSYAFHNIEVEANTRKEAENLAIDEAGSLLFSENDADYSATTTLSKSEQENLFKN